MQQPSASSLRKLLGISGCITSPPTENTAFIVWINHALSGAYVSTSVKNKYTSKCHLLKLSFLHQPFKNNPNSSQFGIFTFNLCQQIVLYSIQFYVKYVLS